MTTKTPYNAHQKIIEGKYKVAKALVDKILVDKDLVPILIAQESFSKGTVIIANDYYMHVSGGDTLKVEGSTQGKVFRLTENIVFNPNPSVQTDFSDHWTVGDVYSTQLVSGGGLYDDTAFGMGFFTALMIIADDIIFDMNGFSITQTPEHALHQRFYSNIELSSLPFLPDEGFYTFGTEIEHATNCTILDGTIGRSSQYGIHGNNARGITLRNLIFENYEEAAISLSGVNYIYIIECRALGHRTDIPVLETWHSARMLRRHLDWLVTNSLAETLDVNGSTKTITTVITELQTAMQAVYQDILGTVTSSSTLFDNAAQIPDRSCYGISINGYGVQDGGFPTTRKFMSSNIYLRNVEIRKVQAQVPEALGLEQYYVEGATTTVVAANKGYPEIDVHNRMFLTQVDSSVNVSGIYTGNVLSNAQAIIAKAILDGNMPGPTSEGGAGTNSQVYTTQRNSITQETIDWIEQSGSYITYANRNIIFNADMANRVQKGVIGLKLDGVDDVFCTNCTVSYVKNDTNQMSRTTADVSNWTIASRFQDDYDSYKNRTTVSKQDATLYGANGNTARAYNFASSGNVFMLKCKGRNIESKYGEAIGVDFHQQLTNFYLESCEMIGVTAASSGTLDDYNDNPEPVPTAYGFKVHSSTKVIILDTTKAYEVTGLRDGKEMEINTQTVIVK
jgi:hypothetical protein